MDAALDQGERFLMYLLLLAWGSGPVIETLGEKIGNCVDQLTSEEWSALFCAVENVVSATSGSRTPMTHMTEKMLQNIKSERLKLALIFRLPKSQRNFLIASFLKPGGLSDAAGLQHIYVNAAGEAMRE